MRIAIIAVFAGLLTCSGPANVYATGLKVAPLQYKTMLKKDEVKKGFIDVSNPLKEDPVVVTSSVQGFRQINDNGGLQFYDDKQINVGIKPELTSFNLAPGEAIRVYFSVDGRNLPKGDIYAGIFFTTDLVTKKTGVGQSVRLGTLLSIINESPGERNAQITDIDVPLFSLEPTVKGTYAIKNTGDPRSGFYPTVTLTSSPGNDKTSLESSLVFGGRERSNGFTANTGYGIHKITASYGESSRSKWVVVVSPVMLLLAAGIVLVVGIEIALMRHRRKHASTS